LVANKIPALLIHNDFRAALPDLSRPHCLGSQSEYFDGCSVNGGHNEKISSIEHHVDQRREIDFGFVFTARLGS
jgi:hypothetical protein